MGGCGNGFINMHLSKCVPQTHSGKEKVRVRVIGDKWEGRERGESPAS